jgi:hypothetical protein
MYHQMCHSKILRSAHTVYVCVMYDLRTISGFFFVLYCSNWLAFITETKCVYCAVRTEAFNASIMQCWSLKGIEHCESEWVAPLKAIEHCESE